MLSRGKAPLESGGPGIETTAAEIFETPRDVRFPGPTGAFSRPLARARLGDWPLMGLATLLAPAVVIESLAKLFGVS